MSKYSGMHLHDSPDQQTPNPGRVHPFRAKLALTAVFTSPVYLLGFGQKETRPSSHNGYVHSWGARKAQPPDASPVNQGFFASAAWAEPTG